MPLQEIDLSNTEVVNMDALAASPLRVISATGLRKLPEDLFTTCPALETVTVSSTTELPRRVTWPAQVKIIRK